MKPNDVFSVAFGRALRACQSGNAPEALHLEIIARLSGGARNVDVAGDTAERRIIECCSEEGS